MVPEITVYFWVIKVLCTTVGETFADFLNGKLGDNLTRTTVAMGSVLIVSVIVNSGCPGTSRRVLGDRGADQRRRHAHHRQHGRTLQHLARRQHHRLRRFHAGNVRCLAHRRSYGNENWKFDDAGYMQRREASINDLAIEESERRIFGPRPDGDFEGTPLR